MSKQHPQTAYEGCGCATFAGFIGLLAFIGLLVEGWEWLRGLFG